MKHRSAAAALLVTASLLLTGAGTTVALADATDDNVKATLRGGPEGDPDGKGKFSATIGEDTLCYSHTVKRVGVVLSSHLHADDGSTVVTLQRTGGNVVCIAVVPDAEDTEETLSESELAAIAADPSGFYVDVHTVAFPDGAISGSLK